MAKFGLFNSGGTKPVGEFDGDNMVSDKEHVKIWKSGSIELQTYDPMNPNGSLIATIHLDRGQYIKKISD
jgi:hypothetical protein